MRLFDPGGSRCLDDVVRAAWDAATAGDASECLVCGSVVWPRNQDGVECPSCHSVLE
jgi:hypothetical protein